MGSILVKLRSQLKRSLTLRIFDIPLRTCKKHHSDDILATVFHRCVQWELGVSAERLLLSVHGLEAMSLAPCSDLFLCILTRKCCPLFFCLSRTLLLHRKGGRCSSSSGFFLPSFLFRSEPQRLLAHSFLSLA